MKKKILLVEDNPDDIIFTKRIIEKYISNQRYDLSIAENGMKAIEYLQSNKMPDVILLDVNLPDMNGGKVLEFIRSYTPSQSIPVVVLSGSSNKNDIIQIYTLGANSYIKKTIDFKRFVYILKTIITYWMNVNVTPRSFYVH